MQKKSHKEQEEKFPMRINKYLALKQHSTRRGADELITQGKVLVNGSQAKLGQMVSEGDKVEVRFRGAKPTYRYLAYHKPRGVVTHSAEEGEEDIADKVRVEGVFPLGRLDQDSSGLILLTDDGRVTDRLLNPKYVHEKEYEVTTKEPLRSNFKEKMESGVTIGDTETTRPCEVEVTGEKSFTITLTEGKNRQIRRMCAALFHEVDTLKRVRVMNIKLGKLLPNDFREIKGAELEEFLTSLGLS